MPDVPAGFMDPISEVVLRVPRRILALIAAVVLVAGSVWFGQAPPRTRPAYEDRAAQTAISLRSQAKTMELWVRAVDDGQVTHAAAEIAAEEAETDAVAAAARFAEWDPPSGTDRLRDELTQISTEVNAILATLRIAAHRGQWAELPRVARQLGPVREQLSAIISDLERGRR